MEKYQIVISPKRLNEILAKYYEVEDTRIHCIVNSLEWKGITVGVFDKKTSKINPNGHDVIYDNSENE